MQTLLRWTEANGADDVLRTPRELASDRFNRK
jgi:hypothetical protein